LGVFVAYVPVRGPELLHAFLAAHVHPLAFRTFLRARFSAPFAGVPKICDTLGSTRGMIGGNIDVLTHFG
jgi:hypothetical protein